MMVQKQVRAKIILLISEGYTVAEIRRQTNHHHDNNIRKWIHRFNDYGIIDGIVSGKHNHHTTPKITDDIERKGDCKDSLQPIQGNFLKFSTWSLRVLIGYGMEKKKKKIVESISHAEIRNVLLKHGIEWRHSKTILGKSRDPVYDLKKAHRGGAQE